MASYFNESMSESFKLTRTKQCAKCPFKKSTNPLEIPNGYDVELHEKLLRDTIATDTIESLTQQKAMACHESKIGKEEFCVGWLWNQLRQGNNIGLRIKMIGCENLNELQVLGEQHDSFEDTLPYNKKK